MSAQIDPEQQRLVTKVALLYHHSGLKQTEISKRVGISQPQVSRLLELAQTLRIVRTTVVVPEGLHANLESELEAKYGLEDVHVAEVADSNDEAALLRDLGSALANHLPTVLIGAKTVGFTSWSRSLRAAVDDLLPIADSGVERVVEMLGDVGEPYQQHEAAQATAQLAEILGADPQFLRVPGVTTSASMRDGLLMHAAHVQETLGMLDRLDVALCGIAACQPSLALGPSDNFFSEEQFRYARSLGAVGEVNLRFIDENGKEVHSELDSLVISVTLDQLKRTPKRVGVAGGNDKREAVRAALRGHWLTTLVTDVDTAEWLLANA